MSMDRELEYVRTLNKFYSAGWDTILVLSGIYVDFRVSPEKLHFRILQL